MMERRVSRSDDGTEALRRWLGGQDGALEEWLDVPSKPRPAGPVRKVRRMVPL